MPIETNCPACGQTLRVPDDLIGRYVKCPACANTFPAMAAPTPDDKPVETFRDSPAPPPLPAADEPPRRPTPRLDGDAAYDDDDDLEDDEDDENLRESMEERYRARRQRGRIERAKSKVSAPAIGLMVVGGLNLAGALLLVALAVYFAVAMPAGAGGPPMPGLGGIGFGEIQSAIFGVLLGTVFGSLILYGAIRMKQLRMYGMAIAACILTLISAFGSCCTIGALGILNLALGLTFSIWAIIVLNDPDVKASFK